MKLEDQYQRILSGQMYDDLTPELVTAREQTVLLTNQYNASFGQPAPEREAILKKLLGHIGQGVHFEPTFRCEFGNHIQIGNNFYDAWERTHGACYAKPVKIGNNVWVGASVHINQGVTIGDNTIIGSGSVITKDIPANVVAAGVPCRVIREITEQDKTGYQPYHD